jgi:GNAT superfamily N-acetyltransferase
MTSLRPYQPGDLDALYAIALATGDSGQDAAGLYRDARLLGHIYAAPYAVIAPETVFVATDGQGIGGYIAGVADTRAFEARLEAAWWPRLRRTYPEPSATDLESGLDHRRIRAIHHPTRAPEPIVARYPAHLHINLLPRMRGRGIGRALMERWLQTVRDLGAGGVHLAVGASNTRAIRFYCACGFTELPVTPAVKGAVWMGRTID